MTGGENVSEREKSGSFLIPGETCWRVERAARVAVLVDGEAYFGALATALERAERSVYMAGWDFHSGIQLRRGGDPTPGFAHLLDQLVRRRRSLRIHVLEWDFAVIYALERQALPTLRMGTRTHRRVRFALDGEHPPGGSHHQKLVVVDDRLAFCGGFDIAPCRWDTREHAADDPRRSDPGFSDYAPFHDVQLLVEGPVAARLGSYFRTRWQRATDVQLAPVSCDSDPWPEPVEPTLRDVGVGIARTEPAWGGTPATREVEALYLHTIRNAREALYFENQYLTAGRVGDALVESLQQPKGPEVVIMAPRECSGWLEQGTMGVLRARLLHRLREADRHDRLRVYYPVLPGERGMNVHAKVLFADDRLMRIGSANLANRSMGLDTELDLAIESRGDPRISADIRRHRDDLIAEHLGASGDAVAEAVRSAGSLIGGIEALRGGARTVAPLDGSVPEWLEALVPPSQVVDPEGTEAIEELARSLLPEELEPRRLRQVAKVASVLAALFAVGLLWRWTSLSEWVSPDRLAALAAPIRATPWSPFAAVGAFVVGGFAMIPVTAMIVASSLVFGPLLGFGVALTGSLASALAGYAAGRTLLDDAFDGVLGDRADRVGAWLRRRGIAAVAAVRVVPVAPYMIVNCAAGAVRVRVRDYVAGTLVGIGPGILVLTLLSDRLARVVIDPSWKTVTALVVVALVGWLGVRALRRRLERSSG